MERDAVFSRAQRDRKGARLGPVDAAARVRAAFSQLFRVRRLVQESARVRRRVTGSVKLTYGLEPTRSLPGELPRRPADDRIRRAAPSLSPPTSSRACPPI